MFFANLIIKAQQVPQYSQMALRPALFNPAAVSNAHAISLEGLLRGQWTGISGWPFSQTVMANMPLPGISSYGGLLLSNDNAGALRSTNFQLRYAYAKKLQNKQRLAFGIAGGIMQVGLNGDELITPDGNYSGSIDHIDPILPAITTNAVAFEVGAGVYWNNQKWYAGLTTERAIATKTRFNFENGNLLLKNQLHTTFNVGTEFWLTNIITLHPNAVVKTNFKVLQTEALLIAAFSEIYQIGIGFRGYNPNSIDAFLLYGGILLNKKLSVGYTYDITLSGLRNTSSGSHELGIKYQNLYYLNRLRAKLYIIHGFYKRNSIKNN
ncbi:MAG: type IX secretion system membrane protein PorP/SprF [Sphingobacteriales bacterium]|nr:type IX secretion system membrane protein PorP/SprF [Sphingobacteriales bacterium]